MRVSFPQDCGNAPRIAIVGEFIAHWAESDAESVAAWLAEDCTWTVIGGKPHHGPDAASTVRPQISPQWVELTSVISHGRWASCDGYLDDGRTRIAFSHVFRFANTAKTAKITEIRSYFA